MSKTDPAWKTFQQLQCEQAKSKPRIRDVCHSPKNRIEELAYHSTSPISAYLIISGGWYTIIGSIMCVVPIVLEYGRYKENFWTEISSVFIITIIGGVEWLLGLWLQDKNYCSTGYTDKRQRRSEAKLWAVFLVIINFLLWAILAIVISLA